MRFTNKKCRPVLGGIFCCCYQGHLGTEERCELCLLCSLNKKNRLIGGFLAEGELGARGGFKAFVSLRSILRRRNSQTESLRGYERSRAGGLLRDVAEQRLYIPMFELASCIPSICPFTFFRRMASISILPKRQLKLRRNIVGFTRRL